MVIVESAETFDAFLRKFRSHISVVVPIFSDSRRHPIVNRICVLYVWLDDGSTYLLPFHHYDAINLSYQYLTELVGSPTPCYAIFKKDLMHSAEFGHTTLDLIELTRASTGKVIAEDKLYLPIQRQMYARYRHIDNINQNVPLVQLYAYCERLRCEYPIPSDQPSGFSFHNDVIIPVCHFLEQGGVQVDAEVFTTYFKDFTKSQIDNNKIYTQYNPYTITHRISNRFGGVNYSALEKHNGCRTAFISRFERGALILIDFESFHLRLIADLIGYPTPTESMHEHFAKQYFDTDTPTTEQYDAGKQLTFSNLYGTHGESDLPYFRSVRQFIETLWIDFNKNGYVEGHTGIRLQYAHVEDPTPSKIFNYLIQLREMEVGIAALASIIPLYRSTSSKLTLYTYDSVLIDYNILDGKDLLVETVKRVSNANKFPVRVYAGPNYHDMQNITNIINSENLIVSSSE